MQTITYGPITIIVGRATGRSDLKATVINRKASQGVPDGTWGIWKPFADNCSQVLESEGLPFDPVTLIDAEVDNVKAAYEAYLDLDKALLDRWTAACKIENAPVDAVLGPNPLAKDAAPNS